MSIVRASNFFDPFSREVWDPFSEYSNVSVVSLPRTSIYDQLTVFANPRIDSKETPDALVFKVGLPRLRKNEVKVHIVRDNLLEISGERKVETEEKNDKWRCVERSSGQFVRRFKLPENVKADQVKADLDNGMLTVTDYDFCSFIGIMETIETYGCAYFHSLSRHVYITSLRPVQCTGPC